MNAVGGYTGLVREFGQLAAVGVEHGVEKGIHQVQLGTVALGDVAGALGDLAVELALLGGLGLIVHGGEHHLAAILGTRADQYYRTLRLLQHLPLGFGEGEAAAAGFRMYRQVDHFGIAALGFLNDGRLPVTGPAHGDLEFHTGFFNRGADLVAEPELVAEQVIVHRAGIHCLAIHGHKYRQLGLRVALARGGQGAFQGYVFVIVRVYHNEYDGFLLHGHSLMLGIASLGLKFLSRAMVSSLQLDRTNRLRCRLIDLAVKVIIQQAAFHLIGPWVLRPTRG